MELKLKDCKVMIDIKPKKVFLLDYNYKNIDCEDDVWVMEGREFKVSDCEGNMLDTYNTKRLYQDTFSCIVSRYSPYL
jgi:hypothetical protein